MLKGTKKRENYKNRNKNVEMNDLTDPEIYEEIFYSSHEELHEYSEMKPAINEFHTKTNEYSEMKPTINEFHTKL